MPRVTVAQVVVVALVGLLGAIAGGVTVLVVQGLRMSEARANVPSREPSPSPSTQSDERATPGNGRFSVQNRFPDEVGVWVDGAHTVLQGGQGTSLPARGTGSSLELYSCGWTAAQTSRGQASGCRFIAYSALPGETWEVIETPPYPRIVMHSGRAGR